MMQSLQGQRIISALSKIFKDDKKVIVGYLFGSVVKNEQNFQSDIDIAIYLDYSYLNTTHVNEIQFEYLTKITETLQTDNVDLVLLNIAPIILSYKIIVEGIVFISRNKDLQADIESLIIRKYLDFKYYSEEYDRCLRKRIRN